MRRSSSIIHVLYSEFISVTEYLNGTTPDVLVITSNATMASDLRVFSSDGNSTIKTFAIFFRSSCDAVVDWSNSLSDSNTFMSQCQSLLGRMLDTVASNVTLGSEVTLLPAKVNSAQLTFQNNQLVFITSFRVRFFFSLCRSFEFTLKFLVSTTYQPNNSCKPCRDDVLV